MARTMEISEDPITGGTIIHRIMVSTENITDMDTVAIIEDTIDTGIMVIAEAMVTQGIMAITEGTTDIGLVVITEGMATDDGVRIFFIRPHKTPDSCLEM